MIAVALKGLAGRKVRALLTAFAVVIGVSMVSRHLHPHRHDAEVGLRRLADAVDDDDRRRDLEKEIVKGSTSGSHATMPASLLDKVRALPGVADAAGEVSPQRSPTSPTSSAATASAVAARASAAASTPPS